MKLLVRTLIFVISFLASILVLPSDALAADPKFAEISSGPWSSALKNKIQSAVVRIKLDAEDSTHCSATFIDNEGTALTALHCLRTCLAAAGNWESGREALPALDLSVVPEQKPVDLKCSGVSVAGRPELGSPSVLYTGWGLVTYNNSFANVFPSLLGELKGKGWSAKDGDIAIIKFENVKTQCLKLSRERAGDLWLVGFPLIDNKAPETHKISGGRAYSSVRDAQFYRRNSGPSYDELYDRPGVMMSSAPNQFGFSGSASVNAQGEIVGLNSALMVTPVERDGVVSEVRETQSIAVDFLLGQLGALGFREPDCR